MSAKATWRIVTLYVAGHPDPRWDTGQGDRLRVVNSYISCTKSVIYLILLIDRMRLDLSLLSDRRRGKIGRQGACSFQLAGSSPIRPLGSTRFLTYGIIASDPVLLCRRSVDQDADDVMEAWTDIRSCP